MANKITSLQVFGKRIFAKSLPKEAQEKKVLILPDANKKEEIFEVTHINAETPIDINIGSKVIVKSNWVSKFMYNENEIVVLTLEEIIGVINEKA